ncbi:MAG: glutaminyl-peptide cyclotransferase [Sedimentisphaerales bacterium]|nr:glutaminyl-peptide cyclotransferase [Sedimentisphaerales bacterium]
MWIAWCGVGVCLCLLAVAWVWRSAPSTAATGANPPADARAEDAPPNSEAASSTPQPPVAEQVIRYRYKVIKSYPHNTENYTQGLVYHDGFLYEGTGLYGQSVLTKRRFTVATSEPNGLPSDAAPTGELGEIVKQTRLPDRYFGEGITLFGDKIIQLTWRSRLGFAYDKETLRQTETFTYDTQGWGLTHDGTRLIMSDGTATLRFLDPNTCAEIGLLHVRDEQRAIRQINELEYIDGMIYANIWPTDYIAIISPQTGLVTGWIDLTGLHTPPPNHNNNVIPNGIAYLPENKHLLVTGKLWPKMFEIELVPQATPPDAP